MISSTFLWVDGGNKLNKLSRVEMFKESSRENSSRAGVMRALGEASKRWKSISNFIKTLSSLLVKLLILSHACVSGTALQKSQAKNI